MNDSMRTIVVAGLGGVAFYIFFNIAREPVSRIEAELLFKAFGFGCLAGLILFILSELGGTGVPFVSSWLALALCVFVVRPMIVDRDLFWHAFIHGYIAYLLWQGYNGKLKKT